MIGIFRCRFRLEQSLDYSVVLGLHHGDPLSRLLIYLSLEESHSSTDSVNSCCSNAYFFIASLVVFKHGLPIVVKRLAEFHRDIDEENCRYCR